MTSVRVSTVVQTVRERPRVVIAAGVVVLITAAALTAVIVSRTGPSSPLAAHPTGSAGATSPTSPTEPGSPGPSAAGPSPTEAGGTTTTEPGPGPGAAAGSAGSRTNGIPGLPAGTPVAPGSGTTGVPTGFPITIDDRPFAPGAALFINGVTSFLYPPDVYVVRMLPGTYQMAATEHSGFTFTVSADGTVAYDPGLDTEVSGAGTPTLTVRGAPVTVDATTLAYTKYSIYLESNGDLTNNGPHTIRLLPGQHSFEPTSTATAVRFTTNLAGTLDYDPALSGFVSGAGTNSLTVRGFPITVDATAVDVTSYRILTDLGSLDNLGPHTLRVVPGTYQFSVPSVNFLFQVDGAGTVGYDASQGYLAGGGTATLTIRGYAITIDGTPIDMTQFYLDNRLDPLPNDRPHTFQQLPGGHTINGGNTFTSYEVSPTGTIVLKGQSPLWMSGAGTSTVRLDGFPVTIDATGSSLDFFLWGETGVFSHTTRHTLHLLPADHSYTSVMPGDNPYTVGFNVSFTGVLTSQPPQAGVSVSGTTLTVTGP
jgi:hypothetical protein